MSNTVLTQKKYLVIIICLLAIGLNFLGQDIPVEAEQRRTDSDLMIRIVPAIQEVRPGDAFVIEVTIEGATDLGGFQFELLYDPTVVDVAEVGLGPFTGSTGRTTNPLGPAMDMKGSAGIVSFGAFTYDSQAGAQGDGVLATLTLTAVGSGTSTLQLQNVQVTDTVGNTQFASITGGTVTVAAPTPTATPTPIPPPPTSPASPTPTSQATATPTIMPVASATPLNTPAAIAANMATATVSATVTAVETAGPTITAVPAMLSATATITTVGPATTVVPTTIPQATPTPTNTGSPTPGLTASRSPGTAAAQLVKGPTALPTFAVRHSKEPSFAASPDLTSILMNCLTLLGCLIFGGLLILIAGCGFVSWLSRNRNRR